MAVTQYIGARYVPIVANPIEWSNGTAYEPLTIVTHEGNSYTSRQYVPIGIDILNDDFWTLTGNYNAQVEQYRQEVRGFDERIATNTTAIANETAAREAAIANETSARETAIANETSAREKNGTTYNQLVVIHKTYYRLKQMTMILIGGLSQMKKTSLSKIMK